MENSQLIQNAAGVDGGAFYLDTNKNMTISFYKFLNNSAGNTGGAFLIFNNEVWVFIFLSEFRCNLAGMKYLNGEGNRILNNLEITRSEIQQTVNLVILQSTKAYIVDVTFNNSTSPGMLLEVDGNSTLYLRNISFCLSKFKIF